jgi:hypothetical protein
MIQHCPSYVFGARWIICVKAQLTANGEDFMRRHLLPLVLTGLFGSLWLASDASACCHKRKCAQPVACAPAPVVVAGCAAAPRHRGGCHHRLKFCGLRLGCHKKVACAPAPCAPYVVPMASPQASPQA